MKNEVLKYIDSGDTWLLAGKHNAKKRQNLMLLITGLKLPVSKCGINAVNSALYKLAGIDENANTIRDNENKLTVWLKH